MAPGLPANNRVQAKLVSRSRSNEYARRTLLETVEVTRYLRFGTLCVAQFCLKCSLASSCRCSQEPKSPSRLNMSFVRENQFHSVFCPLPVCSDLTTRRVNRRGTVIAQRVVIH